jgi:hypothetical protein
VAILALNLDEALHNFAIRTRVAEHLSVIVLQERLVVVALGNGNPRQLVVLKVLAGDRVSSEQDLIAGDGVGSVDEGRSGLPRDGDVPVNKVGLDGGLLHRGEQASLLDCNADGRWIDGSMDRQ